MRLAEGVVFNRVGEELVLLDLNRGVYYGLDPIGARIWQLMAEGNDEAEIVNILTNEYDAPPKTLRADFDSLIAELRERGLVS